MTKTFSNKLFHGAWICLALPVAFFFVPGIHAQPAGGAVESRWLLVFDTSSEMKQRLPQVQAEINNLLAQGMSGRLQPRDSIGVWTFGDSPRTGQFPLQIWAPENAAATASSINKFIGSQRYANSTRFDELIPLLNQVVQNSGRLTVLIFCDGNGTITGMPYDDGINRLFQQRQAAQKNTRQPFVIVLRSQLGKYTGCSVNFPPGMVNLPDFPPVPPPPAPTNAPPLPTPPPEPLPLIGAPLVIVGTNVGAIWPPPAPPVPPKPAPVIQTNAAPAPALTNPVAPVNPVPATNPVEPVAPPNPAPVAESVVETNIPAMPAPVPVPATKSVVQTNAGGPVKAVLRTNDLGAPPESSGSGHMGALILGGSLLVAAGALAAFAFFRARRADHGSLITRTMNRK